MQIQKNFRKSLGFGKAYNLLENDWALFLGEKQYAEEQCYVLKLMKKMPYCAVTQDSGKQNE